MPPRAGLSRLDGAVLDGAVLDGAVLDGAVRDDPVPAETVGSVPGSAGAVTTSIPGPRASRGIRSTQPGRIRLAVVSLVPSGWICPAFSAKISRYRRPSPRNFCAISHKLSWNRPAGGCTT